MELTASPRTRGWTSVDALQVCRSRGFPAHAGMDPSPSPGLERSGGLPRARGDGPWYSPIGSGSDAASPRTRGWTLRGGGEEWYFYGFPAHAGMDPERRQRWAESHRLPRARGDGPDRGRLRHRDEQASPRTRGWTRYLARPCAVSRGFPRARGDGPSVVYSASHPAKASPRTRGWTHGTNGGSSRSRGFPAHAGMDPGAPTVPPRPYRLPRARGDGPEMEFPCERIEMASPRTRGWTRRNRLAVGDSTGFPAHAGMDLGRYFKVKAWRGLPRARGDGPR